MKRKVFLRYLLGIGLVLATGASGAGSLAENGARPGLLPDPFQGVVTNATVTPIGQKFYRYFVAGWRDKELSDRYVLSVHERATARWGSQVWIEYRQRRIFQAFLPLAEQAIRNASAQAVEIVYQNIMNVDVQRLLFRDADLAPDEM